MTIKDKVEWVGIFCIPLLVGSLLFLLASTTRHIGERIENVVAWMQDERAYNTSRDTRWEKMYVDHLKMIEANQESILTLLRRSESQP